MSKEDTQFSSDRQPGKRGRSFKNKLLDVIREQSLADTLPEWGKERTEKAFIAHMAKRALSETDVNSATLLKELLNRSYPALKATLPTIEFEFDSSATPSQQVAQLMDAASNGEISPDIAIAFVHAVKAAVDIEEFTDLKQRIEHLEDIMRG